MMSWTDNRKHYEDIVHKLEPSAILVTKDHWFWKVIAFVLQTITFGQFSAKTFLTKYASTIGPVMAYPKEYKSLSLKLLVHESRHVTQFKRFGLGISPWLGLIPMGICYLLLPFPVLFAYCRYRLELDACVATWRYWMSELGVPADEYDQLIRDDAVKKATRLAGPDYLWTWPKVFAINGFLKAAEEVLDEY